MRMEIVSQNKNPLLKRSDILLKADHSGKATPSRYELLKELTKTLKTREENLVIERITTKAGTGICEIKVHLYSSPNDIPKHKLEKMKRRTKAPKKEEPKETGPSSEHSGEEEKKEGDKESQ